MEEQMPGYPTLFFGSHDMPRLMDRLAGGDPGRAKALAALMLTAKGVPFIYYGEEIGMQNIIAETIDEMVDIQGKTHYQLALKAGKTPEEALVEGNRHNRDKSRSPMQWDASAYAGFSTVRPWIKTHENYQNVNLQQSMDQEKSVLNTYKTLITLRNKEKTLQYGSYEGLELVDGQISFTRTFKEDKITAIINFGNESTYVLPTGSEVLLGNPVLNTNDFLIFRHSSGIKR